MTRIRDLLSWADTRDIQLDRITPQEFPGRGIGIVATEKLEKNTVVLSVPVEALRSLALTPKTITQKLKGATVHAILSASLCKDDPPNTPEWAAILPTKSAFEESFPLCWDANMQSHLPPLAKSLLAKQQAKFDKDWKLVSTAFPEIAKDDFYYAWALVNTRTFYHTTRKTSRLPKDDRMVLQPVADLFNHSAKGCSVSFDDTHFAITTTKAHSKGDELFIRYGNHNNDFLLVEYGFTLPLSLNPWDEISLDPYVQPLFSPAQKTKLKEAGFWSNYKLDAKTACYRTHTALRLLCVSEPDWKAALAGKRDEDDDEAAISSVLDKILRLSEKAVHSTLSTLGKIEGEDEVPLELLRGRWLQIKELLGSHIHARED